MVSNAASACQAACSSLLNLAVGSVIRSILEGCASIGMWIEYLIVQIWLSERLVTSTGTDVDSFVGDFGLTRLPARPATGDVTFSRFYAGMSSLIVPYFNADGSTNAAGAQVLTADLTQAFGVYVDTTQATWNATMGGYLVPAGTVSITVPVQALVAGSAGNVQANAISLLTTAIPGVDTVTNSTVFSNGEDAESDAALKARFQVFVATRAEATLAAVENAIATVQLGLSYAVIENTLPNGTSQPGFFTATVDDGTGNPPTALLSAVYTAIDAVRPIGSTFAVQPPAVITASVSMSISAAAGYSVATLQGQVASAIETYINGLGIGVSLSYTRLSALAYGVIGVATVSAVLLNNGTADIGGGPTQVVKATGASVVINPA
jgi:uncharacterized phage protein gp47/JayE